MYKNLSTALKFRNFASSEKKDKQLATKYIQRIVSAGNHSLMLAAAVYGEIKEEYKTERLNKKLELYLDTGAWQNPLFSGE